jgi:diacylglycerol O-acyltransferase 2, plant
MYDTHSKKTHKKKKQALYCKPNEDVVYLKKRFGFVKLALESGCDLVPVFSFNECKFFFFV